MYEIALEQMALKAMRLELNMEKKPGLVCPSDNGSHKDMDYTLMRRGIGSLRGYFSRAFIIGFFSYGEGDFSKLRQWGRAYERRLLRATGGINTHLGSLFQLGCLCYILGRIKGAGKVITKDEIQRTIAQDPSFHVLAKEGIFGARKEVLSGFFLTFQSMKYPLKNRLIFILSQCEDQNILRRGGEKGLFAVQKLSRELLSPTLKKTEIKTAKERLLDFMKTHHLSPGGAADILINSLFLEMVLEEEKRRVQELPSLLLEEKEKIMEKIHAYSKTGEILFVINLVFPGWVKETSVFQRQFDKILEALPLFILEKKQGPHGFYCFATDGKKRKSPEEWKLWAMDLEKRVPLLDVDIYDGGRVMDRASLGKEQRPCILCGKYPAKDCRRASRHGREALMEVAKRTIMDWNIKEGSR